MTKYPCSLGNVKITLAQKEYIESLERGQKAELVREAINQKLKNDDNNE